MPSAAANELLPASEAPPEPELRDAILKVLSEEPEPISAPALRKLLGGSLRRSEEELLGVLEGLAAAGSLHKFPRFRNHSRFWARSPEEYLDALILQHAGRDPVTQARIVGDIKKGAKVEGTDEKIKQHIRALEKSGRLRKWPMQLGTRSPRYSTQPVDAEYYVEDYWEKLRGKLADAGVDADALARAFGRLAERQLGRENVEFQPAAAEAAPFATTVDSSTAPEEPQRASGHTEVATLAPVRTAQELEELLLERIRFGLSDGSAVVSPRELREQLDFHEVTKGAFDEALLILASVGRVRLTRHPHPQSVDDAQRSTFIADGRGGYYNGISLPRS